MRHLILLMVLSFSCLAADYKKWQWENGEWQLQPVAEFLPEGAFAVMDRHPQLGDMIVIRMPYADCHQQKETAVSAGTMVWGDDYRGTSEIAMQMQCTDKNEVTLFPATKNGAKYIWDSFMSGTSQVTGAVGEGGQAINLVFVSLNFLYAASKFIDSQHQ